MKFWETITSWRSSMWVFVLTISFPFIAGLNEAEESRNEDVDFKEKNKWKFIKIQIVLLPVMKLWENFESLIVFTSRHRLYYLPIYHFQHWFCLLSLSKIYNSPCELSLEWVIKRNKFGRKKRIRNLSDYFVFLQFL